MSPIVRIGDRSVEHQPGQSILETLLRAGVWMPSSCNQGTCGTCKLQVLQGQVDHAGSPLDTLTQDERAQGLALGCQATPCTDMTVALRGAQTRSTHPLRDLTATVTAVEEVARDTHRILLQLDEPLAFRPGQYVELAVPGREQSRQYSLANAEGEDMLLELHVRRVDGGLATDRWLCRSLRVADRVDISGPLGDFHLPDEPDDEGEPMVLIGGGTGLAPLMGIVRTALARRPDRSVLLYHGVRGQEDLYCGEVLAELAAQHPSFRFVQVLSHETGGGTCRSGFPTDVFLEEVTAARGWSGWLCGPPALVEAGVRAFKRRRMAPRQIHREKFTPADTALGAVANAS